MFVSFTVFDHHAGCRVGAGKAVTAAVFNCQIIYFAAAVNRNQTAGSDQRVFGRAVPFDGKFIAVGYMQTFRLFIRNRKSVFAVCGLLFAVGNLNIRGQIETAALFHRQAVEFTAVGRQFSFSGNGRVIQAAAGNVQAAAGVDIGIVGGNAVNDVQAAVNRRIVQLCARLRCQLALIDHRSVGGAVAPHNQGLAVIQNESVGNMILDRNVLPVVGTVAYRRVGRNFKPAAFFYRYIVD